MREGAKMDADRVLKERSFKVRVSDTDLETFVNLCGENDVTPEHLFEVVIGDLTGGDFYSGSDEGRLIDEWLERHHFSWDEDNSLLRWIFNYGGGLDMVKDIVVDYEEKKLYEKNPEEYEKDMKKPIIKWWDDDLYNIADMYGGEVTETELQKVKDWYDKYQTLAEEG